MSTDPGTQASTPSMQRMVIEALAKGSSDNTTLKELLAHAPMSSDQRALMDMLLAQGTSDPRAADSSDEGGDTDEELEETPAVPSKSMAALKREVADLREVNDTLAAALGACPACWGGDPACPGCAGRGKAGSTVPDLELFGELVVPAVRRVRSLERRPGRPEARRSVIDGSRAWRQSHGR